MAQLIVGNAVEAKAFRFIYGLALNKLQILRYVQHAVCRMLHTACCQSRQGVIIYT